MTRDDDLDDLFAQARVAEPGPSPDLLARVLSDGVAVMPAPVRAAERQAAGFWAGLVAAFGGGGALAGLATATLAGVWLGFVQPEPLSVLTDAVWGEETLQEVELFASFDDTFTEG